MYAGGHGFETLPGSLKCFYCPKCTPRPIYFQYLQSTLEFKDQGPAVSHPAN